MKTSLRLLVLTCLTCLAVLSPLALPASTANAETGGAPSDTLAAAVLQRISAGGDSACAIDAATKSVWCWGENTSGQLGDGTQNDRFEAVQVQGLTGEPIAVDIDESHACAILEDASVMCWGRGTDGELGNGGTSNSSTPVAATEVSRPAVALALGSGFSCALLDNQTVQCWGTPLYSGAPSILPGGPYTAISANEDRLCAVTVAATVQCARNFQALTTIDVPDGPVAVATSGGDEDCVITAGAAVSCRGGLLPPITVLSGATSISAGLRHGCASLTSGAVQCWYLPSFDDGDQRAQLGVDQAAFAFQAITVQGIDDAVAVTAGDYHTCAARASGEVVCWGYNRSGQTTDPADASSATPVEFLTRPGSGFKKLALGRDHTCFITHRTTPPECVGSQSSGQTGAIDSSLARLGKIPRGAAGSLPSGSEWRDLDARGNATCGIYPPPTGDDTQVWCWGSGGYLDYHGIREYPRDSPSEVYTRHSQEQLALGGKHLCSRRNVPRLIGAAHCFGSNSQGQIDGNPFGAEEYPTATLVPIPNIAFGLNDTIIDMDSGSTHSCALVKTPTDVQTWCWGNPDNGRTGITPSNGANVRETGFFGSELDLTTGTAHTCVLRAEGHVWCFGDNSAGQLGNGTTDPQLLQGKSVRVEGLSSVVSIQAGTDQTCAINTDGEVWCWGQGTSGQLGNGTMTSSSVPVKVDLPGRATNVALGSTHGCAVLEDGRAFCWGEGANGELGNLGYTRLPRFTGITASVAVAEVLCNDLPVTGFVTAGVIFNGTSGDDVILGTEGNDTINGGGGDDVICGLAGDDIINGDGGDDKIFGNSGADVLHGNAGNDTVHGNRGSDMLYGDDGEDRVFGYAGNDQIWGGPGNDRLHGNRQDDTIWGGVGDDRIFGYANDDTLHGGPGADLLGGNFGDDEINGDAGNDRIYGSDGNDTVRGGDGNDNLEGNSSDDLIEGGPGNDTIDGGINNDTCDGGSGTDTTTRCETSRNVP